MADYIRREDAERALLERCKETGYGGLTPDDIRIVMRTPWRIPAADVRPVVCCKECMYAPSVPDGEEIQGQSLEWPHDEWPEDNPCPCKCEDGWYSYKPKPDFFCANGKREEN